MIRRLAFVLPPLVRLATDDVNGRVVAVDQDRLDLRKVADLIPQIQGRLDRALTVIFRGPELDAGFRYHEILPAQAGGNSRQFEVIQWAADEFLKSLFSFENRSGPGHSLARQQRRVTAVSSRVRECAPLPVGEFADTRLAQRHARHAGDAEGVTHPL